MELRIRSGTVGYNNRILISEGKFNVEKNDEANSLETLAIETNSLETPAIQKSFKYCLGLNTHTNYFSWA